MPGLSRLVPRHRRIELSVPGEDRGFSAHLSEHDLQETTNVSLAHHGGVGPAVPPIDLIDGDRLCELLKRYDLGVTTATRTVEDVTTDPAFFADI